MARVQKNFRAKDFRDADKPETSPEGGPKVEALEETPAPEPEKPVAEPEPKPRARRGPNKSTKPQADVDPHEEDATQPKE